jgi:hypothetical protein
MEWSIFEAPSLNPKRYPRLKRIARDKHSILFWPDHKLFQALGLNLNGLPRTNALAYYGLIESYFKILALTLTVTLG